MKLFEFQAKEVFKENNIPVPHNRLIQSVEELEKALKCIGLPCVLKSQVLQGGRGKAGLICVVKTKEEAMKECKRLFESNIKVRKNTG
jgi:succinyl-CoA synthetase beta subunit